MKKKYILSMIRINASKPRDCIVRSFFVLGAVFFLVKGQGGFCATPDCSGDPVTTTVELVLSDPPDYGFHYLPAGTRVTPGAMAPVPAPCDHHPGDGCAAAAHDSYARAVLKSSDRVFVCRSRISLIRKTIAPPPRSPDEGPLLTC